MINNFFNIRPYNKYFYLAVLFVVFSLLPFGTSKVNYAMIPSPDFNNVASICKNDLAYTFKVSDKLYGEGKIDLTYEDGKIKGIAKSRSSICKHDVDFVTNLDGKLDPGKKTIKMKVNGTGNPITIPVPGKVVFEGPIKGLIKGDKIILSGEVKIKGWLAGYAGFNKTENLSIEITDPEVLSFLRNSKQKLAFIF